MKPAITQPSTITAPIITNIKQSDRARKSTVLPNRRAAELIVELAHRLAALLSVNASLREFSTQWLYLVNASVRVAKTDRAIRPEFTAHLLCCAALVRLILQVETTVPNQLGMSEIDNS